MNLFKILCVVTWASSFLTSKVLVEAVEGPKTPFEGQKWHEGVDLLKKVRNKSFSTTLKTPE